jgi:large subunit ribosomal protein L15
MRKPGRHKQGWTYVIKYEPDYFGKKGFTSPKSLKREENVINVGELEELVEKLANTGMIAEKNGKMFIDLEKLGYTKLLGTGKINKPLIVKINAFSETAAEKLQKVGGQILRET